ncbi:hypothetical protein D3C81_1211780 [compost metagenome]
MLGAEQPGLPLFTELYRLPSGGDRMPRFSEYKVIGSGDVNIHMDLLCSLLHHFRQHAEDLGLFPALIPLQQFKLRLKSRYLIRLHKYRLTAR